MNAFELLINDHQKVAELFEQIENDRDTAMQENLFARIKKELTIHTEIEETYFYPRLKSITETADLIGEAVIEHQDVKNLLIRLEEMSPDNDEWESLIQELKNSVEHHVEEEEEELFPKAQEVLSEREIEQIGEEMRAAKQELKKAAA
jgi:hemerythrin superfamily protein